MIKNLQPGDRVRYRGVLGTVRCVAHWMSPASIDVRLDDDNLVYDLEIHFKKVQDHRVFANEKST